MSLREFAEHYNLSEPTLKRWRDPAKLPTYGKLLFESMIKIKELEKKTRLLDDMADYFNDQKMK
jgi:DNA-binding transcriptional regulator YiaG